MAEPVGLRCVIDQLTPAQRQSIGSAMLSGDGQDATTPSIEGATASCATKYKPAEVSAAVQYANDTVVYEASDAKLRSLGAPGLIGAVWAKVEPAKRKTVADALKAGSPPDDLVSDLQSKVPKGDDALAVMVTAMSGLQARAAMSVAEAAAG